MRVKGRTMVPDRIERELMLRHPVERVWQALTTAEGLAGWFGSAAEIDLRPGGRLWMRWESLDVEAEATVTVVEPPHRFGYRWGIDGLLPDDPHRNDVVFTLSPTADGTRLRVVESGFDQVVEDVGRAAHKDNSEGWDSELADLVAYLDSAGDGATA
jgi:uncharacterized protein YndB with AHSA1/START domain